MTSPDKVAFLAWVDRWGIGPGMNDRWRIERANEVRVADGEPLLPLPTRYSGYDGIVGQGWLPLLDSLAHDLKALGWDGSVKQIKEKFGTLRFYAVPNGVPADQHDAFRDRITQAELESAATCEDCGSLTDVTTAPLPNRHWLRTLCKVCRTSTEPTA